MSESLTALASENLNPSLRSLLEDVQRGHIRVPRFQRPFVWTDLQRLQLLESIRDNMPIGSLLVWRTIKFKLATFPSVGPHEIPPIVDFVPATGWQYLLDGHQRVSTLLGLLIKSVNLSTPEQQAEDEIDWNIQYDLMEEAFVFTRKTKRKSVVHPLLPLSSLFDGRMVNRHMREIRKLGEIENWTEENMEDWEARADQLSYRFQQCRIPIVVMVTDDLSLAAKTFQRINSLGTPMDEAHLVAALTWTADFDLRDRLNDMRQILPAGWRKLDDGIFLQVCKGLSGLDMTKAGQPDLVKKLAEDSTLLEKAGLGIARAIALLDRLGSVVHQELLPYSFQLVLISVVLASEDVNPNQESGFMAWFWRTSWTEVFSTASFREVRSELSNLRNADGFSEPVEWSEVQELPERFDFRLARVRLFVLRLAARHNLLDDLGQKVDGRRLLENYGREAFVRLFTAPRNASSSLKKLLQGVGNRFLIDPHKDSILRDRLKHGPDLSDEVLHSFFIDQVGLTALRAGDMETFINRRAAAIATWDLLEREQENRIDLPLEELSLSLFPSGQIDSVGGD
jgi:hypothetical protein